MENTVWGAIRVIGSKLFIFRDTQSWSIEGQDLGLDPEGTAKSGVFWTEQVTIGNETKYFLYYVDYNGRRRVFQADVIEHTIMGVPYQTGIGKADSFPPRWLWWLTPDNKRVGIGHGDIPDRDRHVDIPYHEQTIYIDAPKDHNDQTYEYVDGFFYSDINMHMDGGYMHGNERYHSDRPTTNHWDYTDHADGGSTPHNDNGYTDTPPTGENFHVNSSYVDNTNEYNQNYSLGQNHHDWSDLTEPPIPFPYIHDDNGYIDIYPSPYIYYADSSYKDNTSEYNKNFSLGTKHYDYTDHMDQQVVLPDQSFPPRFWGDWVQDPRHADSTISAGNRPYTDHTDGYSDHSNSGHSDSDPFPHNNKPWQDVGHVDFGHADDLYFPPYSDGGHSDVHGDHFDNHGDTPSHDDAHGDSHSDHSDNHSNSYNDHGPTHTNLVHYDMPPEGYTDHQDHSNVLHEDSLNIPPGHLDHQDHGNVLHYDTPPTAYVDLTHINNTMFAEDVEQFYEYQDREVHSITNHGDYPDVTRHVDHPTLEHQDVSQYIDAFA